MSSWRPNAKTSLTNSFAGATEAVDSLPIVWPHNATNIDNPNWFAADELGIVPSSPRLIKAAHFNSYADSVCALEYYLRDHQGEKWLIDANGNTTHCTGSLTPHITGTMVVSSIYQGANFLVALQTVTVTGLALSMLGSAVPYNYTYTGTIPSVFGTNPWSSHNFNIAYSSEIQGSGLQGLWAGQPEGGANGRGIVGAINSTPFIFTSVTPVSGQPTLFNCYLRILNFTTPTSGDSISEFWRQNWYPLQYAYGGSSWFDNSTPFYVAEQTLFTTLLGGTRTYQGQCFTAFHSTKQETIGGPWGPPQTGSLDRWQAGRFNDSNNNINGESVFSQTYGIVSDDFSLAQANVADVGIDFTIHSWNYGWGYAGIRGGGVWTSAIVATGYPIKHGVFLRLSEQLYGVDAKAGFSTNMTQYTGYLLRLGAVTCTSGLILNSSTTVRKSLACSYAIMKVRYESFSHASYYSGSYTVRDDFSRFWFDTTNGSTLPPTGTWFSDGSG